MASAAVAGVAAEAAAAERAKAAQSGWVQAWRIVQRLLRVTTLGSGFELAAAL